MEEHSPNPKQRLSEKESGSDGAPRFGRLLLALAAAVAVIILVTFVSAAWYGQ